jgi:hypothetical protein
VTQDDLLYRFRLRVFAMAGELGNVRAACRAMGIHPWTYYRWKRRLDRYGPEILRPRERRPPRMAPGLAQPPSRSTRQDACPASIPVGPLPL